MPDTTVRDYPANSYTSARAMADTFRRIADALDEISEPIADTTIGIEFLVYTGPDAAMRQRTVELLDGPFHDEETTYSRYGIYGFGYGQRSLSVGAYIRAMASGLPAPKRVVEAAELDAYAEQEQRDEAELAETVKVAMKAYRALPDSHTPEDAVNAIRGALGIDDELTAEIPIDRAEYDRRAGEASDQLGQQLVAERMAETGPDAAVIAATVDAISGTPKMAVPAGAFVPTPAVDALAGPITATAITEERWEHQCELCNEYRPYAELEDNAGVCSACLADAS